jgi:hypothetical protein
MRNHHQCPIGMAPLPKVNYSSRGNEKMDGAKLSKNVGKFKKGKKKAQEEQIQRPKFGERKEILQVPPLWWCESYCKEV